VFEDFENCLRISIDLRTSIENLIEDFNLRT